MRDPFKETIRWLVAAALFGGIALGFARIASDAGEIVSTQKALVEAIKTLHGVSIAGSAIEQRGP